MSIITDTYYENKSVKKHIYMYYKKCVHVVIEIYKYEKYIHMKNIYISLYKYEKGNR